ncbi:protein OPI10 homolog [Musa acuminata AAA Group]|uniref:protein OPI10 homolog n=1 Tax=Musa acuminata AAA Group TaxID=214697 RepID=UPI0031DB7F2C
MFGVVFPERSYPMDASAFAQIDPLHWVLDMASFVGDAYRDVKEVCVFLLPAAAASFPPGKALAVYVQPPGHPFLFCGAVHPARPSALLALPWPDLAEDAVAAFGVLQVAAASAKIGVSVEDFASLPPVADAGAERRAERLALRVGENLFNFMQSFCGVDGSRLVVPMDILDRWFKKFQERAKKDPSYLKNFSL